jgi:hypothetical protein
MLPLIPSFPHLQRWLEFCSTFAIFLPTIFCSPQKYFTSWLHLALHNISSLASILFSSVFHSRSLQYFAPDVDQHLLRSFPKEAQSLLRFSPKEIKENEPKQQFWPVRPASRPVKPTGPSSTCARAILESWPGMTGPQAGHTGQLTVPHRQQFQRIWPV